jgi:hypothetical protein
MADKVEIHKARDVFHGEHKLADEDAPIIQNAVAETGVVNPLTVSLVTAERWILQRLRAKNIGLRRLAAPLVRSNA